MTKKQEPGKQMAPIDQAFATLERMEDTFKASLPEDVSVKKFINVAQTAINQNRDLLNCDRNSLFNSCVKAAQDGLLPDNREGALVIFGKQVQWMPMVNGLIKSASKSGIKLDAQVVFENDNFTYELGDDPKISHYPPKLGDERGKPLGVYAIATLPDGTRMREIMSVDDVNKVKAVSRSANANGSPWKTWWDEMARKTVIRRLFKRLPLDSSDGRFVSSVTRDDENFDFETEADDPRGPIVHTERSGALNEVASRGKKADQDVSDVDPETGEVVPEKANENADIFDD